MKSRAAGAALATLLLTALSAAAAGPTGVSPRELAEYHAGTGNEQLVLDSYAKALAADPADALTYQSRGFYYLKRGMTELALEDFTKQIRIRPSDPAGYLNRALLLGSLGRNRDAAADFAAACRLGSPDGCALGDQTAAPEK